MRLRTLLLLLIVMSGCSRAPVVEIANTSGIMQQVAVFSETDIYLVDSVSAGQTMTWVVPDHARDRRVVLSIAVSRETEATTGWPTQLWVDSIILDRSQFIQIHAPAFSEATPAWKERAKRFGTVDRRDSLGPPKDALAEIWDTRPAGMRWPTAPHYVPTIKSKPKDGMWGSAARYLAAVSLGVIALWTAVFFLARWALRRARALGLASGLAVGLSVLVGGLIGRLSTSGPVFFAFGAVVGSTVVFTIPTAVAIILEFRRRGSRRVVVPTDHASGSR